MKKITSSIFVSITVLLALTAVAKKPNVIVIMADDLGYGDLGATGQNPRI